MAEKFYSAQELREWFGVSRYSIYRAQKNGTLPVSKKVGTQNYYSEETVMKYIGRSDGGKKENQ